MAGGPASGPGAPKLIQLAQISIEPVKMLAVNALELPTGNRHYQHLYQSASHEQYASQEQQASPMHRLMAHYFLADTCQFPPHWQTKRHKQSNWHHRQRQAIVETQ